MHPEFGEGVPLREPIQKRLYDRIMFIGEKSVEDRYGTLRQMSTTHIQQLIYTPAKYLQSLGPRAFSFLKYYSQIYESLHFRMTEHGEIFINDDHFQTSEKDSM
jgi:hypothetical protein